MPRTQHRRRIPVSNTRAKLLPLLGFRYSTSRDAYILRLVGDHVGPVFQVDASHALSRPH